MAKTATRGTAGVRDLASSHRSVGEGAPRIDAVANMLPNSNGQAGTGNGNYTLYVYAHDREGKTIPLQEPADRLEVDQRVVLVVIVVHRVMAVVHRHLTSLIVGWGERETGKWTGDGIAID